MIAPPVAMPAGTWIHAIRVNTSGWVRRLGQTTNPAVVDDRSTAGCCIAAVLSHQMGDAAPNASELLAGLPATTDPVFPDPELSATVPGYGEPASPKR